jgi:hypothetical protein
MKDLSVERALRSRDDAVAQLAAALKLPPASGTVFNIVEAIIKATMDRMEAYAEVESGRELQEGEKAMVKQELADRIKLAPKTLGLPKKVLIERAPK